MQILKALKKEINFWIRCPLPRELEDTENKRLKEMDDESPNKDSASLDATSCKDQAMCETKTSLIEELRKLHEDNIQGHKTNNTDARALGKTCDPYQRAAW